MSTNDWVIETENLTRRFKKVTAVSKLSLQISRGEIFSLVVNTPYMVEAER